MSFPKPSRLADRQVKKRDRFLQGRAFRAAVWKRDRGLCQYCGQPVKRTLELDPLRGEVHHLRGRNVAPEDRYNPDAAVLLCLWDHMRAQRYEITVTA